MLRKFTLKYATFFTAFVLLLLLGLRAFGGCQSTLAYSHPVVVGHRGSSGGVENTLPAIQHALDLGVDYIEVDVCLSADNVPVVYHDETLTRLGGKRQAVCDLTAAQLQRIELHQGGYTGQIPTLQQVIDICRGNVVLVIDIKRFGDIRNTMGRVGMLLDDNDFFSSCVVMSQSLDAVLQFKKKYPAASISYCHYNGDHGLNLEQLLDNGIDFLVVEANMATKELLKGAQSLGLPAYICTVNSLDDMKDYLELGAAGIVTDNPEAALDIIGQISLKMQAGSISRVI